MSYVAAGYAVTAVTLGLYALRVVVRSRAIARLRQQRWP
jgi:hypothetical protein